LNVDDDIWEDFRLDDSEGPVHRWLGDEDVCRAIPAMLDWNRVREELARLDDEEESVRLWLQKEQQMLHEARVCAKGESLISGSSELSLLC